MTTLPTLTRTLEFFVPGKPVAWARAGARAGIAKDGHAFVRHFTKSAQRPYAAMIRDAAKQAMAAELGFNVTVRPDDEALRAWDTPLEVDIRATFTRPKSHFTSKGALVRGAPSCYTRTPDVDNLAKMVGDALNGVLWQDDAQIIKCCVWKVWGDVPGVRVLVKEARVSA